MRAFSINLSLRTSFLASCLVLTTATPNHAGGLERGGNSIDLLFNPNRYAAQTTAGFVMPGRKLNNVQDNSPLNGPTGGGKRDRVRATEAYSAPQIGFKVGLTDSIDCMFGYSQPWGAHSNPGINWAGANDNIETLVNSHSYSGTCSYRLNVTEAAQFRLIGGLSYQEFDGFQEKLVAPVPTNSFGWDGVGRLNLETSGWGQHFGISYEIPDYIFRTTLIYRSEVRLNDITGTLDLTGLPPGSGGNPLAGGIWGIRGSTRMPQSLEFQVQSGIAPNWLAFGSVKWVDWSILQEIPFYHGQRRVTSIDLLYQDGWTVKVGIGHKFNDHLSGAIQTSWDRGTSTTIGSQTDTWAISAGLSYAPTEFVALKIGGLIGILTGGTSSGEAINPSTGRKYSDISYSFDDDIVTGLNASLKLSF